MAQDQKKVTTGGNKPKPPGTGGGPSGQSAKDRSKAQSRPVTGKAPAGKPKKASGAGGGKGGNTPRPGSRPPAQPKPRGISGTLIAWSAVGLVIIVIAVLVIVKVTGSSNAGATAYTPVTPAPASVVHDVTNIPASVYNQVGVSSSAVTPPDVVKGQPSLTIKGKAPSMLYVGAEYCPFCAAERWGMTAALSRFGSWSNLKITASSHTDYAAATNTFSFYGATLTSPYIQFVPVEVDSNIPDANAASGYKPLMTLTSQEATIATKYSASVNATQSGGISFPFVDIDNKVIISGASYDPQILAGQTWQQIASGLSDASNPATQAIVSTANYISAGICAASKGAPASVCTSSGVEAAAKALKLS
jgi:hypothetical protein